MKYLTTAFLILATTFGAYSQTYEIGGILGGANYIGDVGNTTYINPNSFAAGGIFKWNRSARHSFRASIMFLDIKGDDSKSSESRRQQRDYSFENKITEFSVGLEYTFWDFDVHSQKSISTPYLYTGITYLLYDALYKSGDKIRNYDGAQSFAIPMILGYKANINRSAMIGFEIGARYTFTDDLDGSNPVNGLADEDTLKFGNVNSDDWYVFTGVTVTFAFGRKPCYCNF